MLYCMQKNMYPIHFSFWYIVDTAVLIACLAWVQKSTIFFSTKKRFLREKKNTEKSHARNVKENLTEYPSNLSILS